MVECLPPSISKKNRTEQVRELATELGFDVVAFTSLRYCEEGEGFVKAWVSEGRHGTMRYLEELPQRRQRFLKQLGKVRSVIVLGVNYFSSFDPRNTASTQDATQSPLQGRIARYAWGRDYHLVIKERHSLLISKLKEMFGPQTIAFSCVDIQPFPEKHLAAKAGVGFVGKHTTLLNRRFGPWLFLSEIVTNVDLEENLPTGGDCGACTHCQRVCPTGALDQDYRMDARRCIAYLTIEHKGIIPRELRPHVKNWIFGCDACLEICPFTSKSKETHWPELCPEAGFGPWLDISKLFELTTNSRYRRYFQGTALLRVNRKQMWRNACLVLANSRNPEAIPYLQKALEDPAPLVRLHAAWGLGQFPHHTQAKEALQARLMIEKDPEVLQEIQNALALSS